MNRAFITIEVLIAMLILFITIATLSSATKFFTTTKIKKIQYEEYYRAFLNIKDRQLQLPCSANNGVYNGFSYEFTCKLVKKLRNYKPAFDEGDESGNIGQFTYSLYENTLSLQKEKFTKSLTYYITDYQHD
jgi:hypothetical protein